MPLPAGPAQAGEAGVTDQQHFPTLSHPDCSGKRWQQLTSFSPVSLTAPASSCWHCPQTISMLQAALRGLATACMKWYNCKDFVVVKILKTSRPKKTQDNSGVKGCLGPEGQGGGLGRGTVCTAVWRLVALRKSCIFCWRRHRCPYHLPLMAVQHLGVPQPGDYISLPPRREMSSHFPQGALTAKWIETFSGLFLYDLKVSEEVKSKEI